MRLSLKANNFYQELRLWNRRRLMRRHSGRGNSTGRAPVFKAGNIIDLSSITAKENITPNIGVHIHLHYSDLVPHFTKFLNKIPLDFDLLVSFSGNVTKSHIDSEYASLKKCRQVIARNVPNRGRDIAPFVCEFAQNLTAYDVIAHVHGKKSLYNNGATAGWLEYLCENLFSSEEDLLKIFSLLSGSDFYGIVYPLNFHVLPPQANTWLANKSRAHAVANRIGIKKLPEAYIDYPAGSMFWARTGALAKILNSGFNYDDFDPEQGQKDGTLAHALERLFAITVKDQGYKVGILQDRQNPTWSPWRFDRYDGRRMEDAVKAVSDKSVELVAFDVFDTLLCRPMIDPDFTKNIIEEIIGNQAENFKHHRHEAERLARIKAKRDVGLAHIYDEFSSLTNCTNDTALRIRETEELTELNSLLPREDGQHIFRAAVAAGKKVVLISDMFLDSKIISAALKKNGVTGWSQLYVSSEVGIRKDSGELYKHVLEQTGVNAKNALMVGDNERSDWQIPTDMGMRTIHLPRATDRARASIRFAPLVEAAEQNGSIDANITIGIVAQAEFGNTFGSQRNPEWLIETSPHAVGRSVLGPLVTAFASWLDRSTQNTPGAKLFFLAREGETLKIAFDVWAEKTERPTSTEYLVLSRRCVNVSAIESFEDIMRIAEADYLLNSAAIFLKERFGVEPSEEDWNSITTTTGWTKDKLFEIKNKDTDAVVALLRATERLIMDRVKMERPGLIAYLKTIGLIDCEHPILVDVGYSGTIQGALMRILKRNVWGMYIATDSAINKINIFNNDVSKGCFANKEVRTSASPFVLRESFLLEKLLSSDTAQVVYHELKSDGTTVAHYRAITDQEIATRSVRRGVRAGMFDFIEAAMTVRSNLKPDFSPPREIANHIYELYVSGSGKAEVELSRKIVLDDFYCGRGIVS